MTTEEILIAGRYAGIPYVVLASHHLTPADKLVYQAILSHLGKNESAWPGQKTTALKTGLGLRVISNAVKRLTGVGLITVEPRRGRSPLCQFNNPTEALENYAKAGGPGTACRGSAISTPAQNAGVSREQTPARDAGYPCTPCRPTPAQNADLPLHEMQDTPARRADELLQEQLHLTTPDLTTPLNTSLSRFASETDIKGSLTSTGLNDSDDLCIEDGMHKERFTQLVKSWKQEIGPLTLSSNKIIACYKLCGIEEQKTGQTLQPATLIAAARLHNLEFTALFTAYGDSFAWNNLQTNTYVSPKSKAMAEIEGAIKRKAIAKNPWPAETVEMIYNAYPRKVGRGLALPAIQKALTLIKNSDQSHDPITYLLGRVQSYARSRANEDLKFTPHPATWFNQLRYMDEIEDLTIDRTSNLKSQDMSNYVPIVNEVPKL
jgi:hypothetical protein